MKIPHYLKWFTPSVLGVIGILMIYDGFDKTRIPHVATYARLAASWLGVLAFVISALTLSNLIFKGAKLRSVLTALASTVLALGITLTDWSFSLIGLGGILICSRSLWETDWSIHAFEAKESQGGQGARQPATAENSKSEGKEKTKPESEGRSQ